MQDYGSDIQIGSRALILVLLDYGLPNLQKEFDGQEKDQLTSRTRIVLPQRRHVLSDAIHESFCMTLLQLSLQPWCHLIIHVVW